MKTPIIRKFDFTDISIPLDIHIADSDSVIARCADESGYFSYQNTAGHIVHLSNIQSIYYLESEAHKRIRENNAQSLYFFTALCSVVNRSYISLRYSSFYSYERTYHGYGIHGRVIYPQYISNNKDRYGFPSFRVFTEFVPREFICRQCLKQYDPFSEKQLQFKLH